jgi:GntR family transcriptional regulator
MPINGNLIDKSTPMPIYFQLKSILLAEIKNGNYPVGSCIPTENELQEIFHISRTPIRQAIGELVSEGWLYRVSSKGTFVAKQKVSQTYIQRIEPFNEQIERTGRTPRTELLEMNVFTTPEEYADTLNLEPEDKIICLLRRRFANEEPLVSLRTILPYSLCSFVLGRDFTRESLYDIMSEHEQTRVVKIKRKVEAVEANEEDAKLLEIEPGKPILLFTSTAYNEVNEPVEISYARYRGDRNSFFIDVFRDVQTI